MPSSGWVGGWILAGGMLAPLARIKKATRLAAGRIALPPDLAGRPQ